MKPFAALGSRGQVDRLRRLADTVLRDYEVRPALVIPLTHLENTTFRVEDAARNRYLLRIHRVTGSPWHPPRSETEVRSEMEWLTAIRRDTDLIVPEPVPRRDGGLLTVAEVEGVPEPRVCAMFRWVDGRFFDEGLTPRHLEWVGQYTARLHEQSVRFAPSTGFARPRVAEITDDVVAYALAEVTGTIGADAARAVIAAFDQAREVQRVLGEGGDSFGLIHGDLHQENYLFSRGEVRAIDFDDCGWGHYLYDLAVTLSEVERKPRYSALREALLGGYRSVQPLALEHERLLEAFQALRCLQLALWFIEQRDHPGFPDWEDEARDLLHEVEARSVS